MASTTAAPAIRLEAGSEVKVPDGKGGEKLVTLADRIEVHEPSEDVLALVGSGEILRDENVIVKIEDAYVVYTQFTARTLAGAKALVNGAEDLVLDEKGQPKRGEPSVTAAFNYGFDLDAKRAVRQSFEKKASGPAKDIKKAVGGLMALGYSEEDALALAKAKLPTA